MALGTELAHPIMEMRVLLIGKKLSKAERSATSVHGEHYSVGMKKGGVDFAGGDSAGGGWRARRQLSSNGEYQPGKCN